MNKRKILLLSVLVLTFLFSMHTALYSQEVSEKKDIAIFRLSYYDWSIPNEALGSIDAQIREVFVNLGRFNVIGITQRLGAGDVNVFINRIRSIKEQDVEIPEEVAMGHEIFTEADLNRLVSSFIVIIPAVTYYDVKAERDDNGQFLGHRASISTSFSVLNVETMILEKEILIETSGFDKDNRDEAIKDAINSITGTLAYEVKSVPIFILKSGVLQVYNGGVTLELGKNRGIVPGYEFVIMQETVIKEGLKRERETGLLLVNSVSEEVCEATIIYGNPVEGDQVKEVPRQGIHGGFYIRYVGDFADGNFHAVSMDLGFEATLALNVYAIRPFVGAEIPIILDGTDNQELYQELSFLVGIPFRGYIGVEYSMRKGRLLIAPSVAAGVAGVSFYDETKDAALTHFGGFGVLNISYLFSRDMFVSFDAGYEYYVGAGDFPAAKGIILGGGITLKL